MRRAREDIAGSAPRVCPFQHLGQSIQVVVAEDAEFGAAKAGGIDQAGMHQFVDEDHILLFQQRADSAESRGITAGEGQRSFRPFEVGEDLLQFMMRAQRTADQPGGAGAGAELDRGSGGRFLEMEMVGQPQVIVGGKVEQRLTIDDQVRALRRVHAAQLAVESLAAQVVQLRSQFEIKGVHRHSRDPLPQSSPGSLAAPGGEDAFSRDPRPTRVSGSRSYRAGEERVLKIGYRKLVTWTVSRSPPGRL